MIHLVYLIVFSFFMSVVFATFFDGSLKEKTIHGLKTFLKLVFVSLAIGWIFYIFF